MLHGNFGLHMNFFACPFLRRKGKCKELPFLALWSTNISSEKGWKVYDKHLLKYIFEE